MDKVIFFVLLALISCCTNARTDKFYNFGPATIECVIEAAQKQEVPANVLLAIASIEGGRNGQYVKNKNLSFDIGHFQINTIHWQKGGWFYNDPGIRPENLAWRGCYNAEVAAWILRQELNRPSKQDFWTRAANYHSRTKKYNDIYRSKLIKFSIRWGKWLQAQYLVEIIIETDMFAPSRADQ